MIKGIRKNTYLTLFILTALLLQILPAKANIADYKIKSIWLYSLASSYISWPKNIEGNIRICTIGLDRVGPYLRNNLSDKNISSFQIGHSDNSKDCHIIYISTSESDNISPILRNINKHNSLTISDIEDFSEMGGMIEFIFEKNFVSLKINLKSLEKLSKQGIFLDSYVIDTAETIYK